MARRRGGLALAAAASLLLALAGLASPAAAKKPGLWQAKYNKLTGRTSRTAAPEFCVVVRTYWGHGASGDNGLRRLLRSLQRQTVQAWEAVLLVLDSRPFGDLHHIVESFDDERIWVFAEWIDQQFTPKQGVEWAPGYHGTLYNLTDDAIQVCPPTTRWLVVTNGDNEYAADFMERVRDAGAAADLVAVDFYSRFQRPTAPACDRFAAAPGAPACKRNRLRWCHTDLGANVIAYPRFVRENRRFGTLGSVSGGLGAEHFDGIMMQLLLAAGWRVVRLADACPFNHAPSLQSCGWAGGVWDDRDIVSWSSAGGRCITPAEADAVLAGDANAEEVAVNASTDGHASAFEGVAAGPLAVRCLRRRDFMSDAVLGLAMEWFNALCVDDTDMPTFRRWQQLAEPGAAGEGAAAEAAEAAAAEEAARAAAGEGPDDFFRLQQEFYGEQAKAQENADAAGGGGAEQQPAAGKGGGEREAQEQPATTQ